MTETSIDARADRVASEGTAGGVPGAPTSVVAAALPMSFKLSFERPANTGASPIVTYYAYDVQHNWLHSNSYVESESPILIQGGSGTGSFVVYACNANGCGPSSTVSNAVTSVGGLPAYSDPYWIYHAGTFSWNADYSLPNGATYPGVIDPEQFITLDWFDTSVPAVKNSGPSVIKVGMPTFGNFAPSVSGFTIDLGAHPYAYWTGCIRPSYEDAGFHVELHSGDVVVTKSLSLNAYGTFTKDAWSCINVPFSDFDFQGTGLSEIVITPVDEVGTFFIDNLGFANSPQAAE